jgi:hypothetical protein
MGDNFGLPLRGTSVVKGACHQHVKALSSTGLKDNHSHWSPLLMMAIVGEELDPSKSASDDGCGLISFGKLGCACKIE